ncbi:MAG TPA: gephyrin-like molybdotransferase Glp [Kofleriaceae bacterium]|nr:gephyrin-like molybdotransferase Glp [Kofleriaceae bacterium]
MLSVRDAAARTRTLCPRLPLDEVAVDDACGRVLAADVIATRPLPACDSSAMDGFAVRAADLPGTLPVVGRVAAGHPPPPLPAGAAVRIMTGAPMPAGADTVVIFEDARDRGATVELPAARPGANVRRAGEDLAVGDIAVPAGVRVDWGEIAAIAALGQARIAVSRRPHVAIIATGDELVELGHQPAPHQVVDSSAHALRVMIAEAGGVARHLGIARDREDDVHALVARALGYDVVLTTGGVSAGDHDHVREALAAAGVALDFWKVAMKPGKPLAVGTAGDTVVFALPGNPVSSLVAFELFVRPALLCMQGCTRTDRPRAPVVVPDGYRKAPGRAHFLRARVHRDGERLIATPLAKQGSHMLSSLVGVDALVELDADGDGVAPGATAPALLLRAV